MRVSIIQMESTEDKKLNLEQSLGYFDEALEEKPDLVVYPEYQMHLPDFHKPELTMGAAEPTDGDFVTAFLGRARENHVMVLLNIAEQERRGFMPFNTSVLIDDLGVIAAKYRKLHLFDAYSMRESSVYQQGRLPLAPAETPAVKLGIQICYDLRFPEPARLLRIMGADIISYQAGWFAGERKLETWRTLLRSRAIENGSFVIASAQCGPKFTGHSLAVNPYGDVMGELESQPGILTVDMDMSLIERYARDVPVMKQRRKDIYDISGY